MILPALDLSLRIELVGGLSRCLVQRNMSAPLERTLLFTNAREAEDHLTLRLLAGERPMSRDNITLLELNFPLDPRPRGEQRIEISVEVDVTLLGELVATCLKTGVRRQQRFICCPSSPDLIQNHLLEAALHFESDRAQESSCRQRLRLQSMILAAELTLHKRRNELGSRVLKCIEDSLANARLFAFRDRPQAQYNAEILLEENLRRAHILEEVVNHAMLKGVAGALSRRD